MQNNNNEKNLNSLVLAYEAMSQKGAVCFLEETVFEQIAGYYMSAQRSHLALEVLSHAMVQYPYSANFHIRHAEILIYDGQYDAALLSLDKAAAYHPSSVKIAIIKIKVLMELGSAEEAFKIIDTTRHLAFGKALGQLCYLEALLFEEQGEYQRMYDSLHYALTIDPQNEHALSSMIWAVELNGKHEEVTDLYEKIIDSHPYSDHAWFCLGYAYSGLDDWPMAMEAFEYAFIINPDNEYAYREFGDACIKAEKYNHALDGYDEFLNKFDGDGEIWLNKGKCHEAIGEFKQAKLFFKRAVQLMPQNAEAHYRMGNAFAQKSQWHKATKSYKKAIHLDRRKEEYVTGLANAFYFTGEHQKARALYAKATEMAPETSQYWVNHAIFLLDSNEPANAITVLDEAEIYTSGTDLLYCRVAALLQLNQRQEALYLLGEALIANHAMHLFLLGLMPTLERDLEVTMLIEKFKEL